MPELERVNHPLEGITDNHLLYHIDDFGLVGNAIIVIPRLKYVIRRLRKEIKDKNKLTRMEVFLKDYTNVLKHHITGSSFKFSEIVKELKNRTDLTPEEIEKKIRFISDIYLNAISLYQQHIDTIIWKNLCEKHGLTPDECRKIAETTIDILIKNSEDLEKGIKEEKTVVLDPSKRQVIITDRYSDVKSIVKGKIDVTKHGPYIILPDIVGNHIKKGLTYRAFNRMLDAMDVPEDHPLRKLPVSSAREALSIVKHMYENREAEELFRDPKGVELLKMVMMRGDDLYRNIELLVNSGLRKAYKELDKIHPDLLHPNVLDILRHDSEGKYVKTVNNLLYKGVIKPTQLEMLSSLAYLMREGTPPDYIEELFTKYGRKMELLNLVGRDVLRVILLHPELLRRLTHDDVYGLDKVSKRVVSDISKHPELARYAEHLDTILSKDPSSYYRIVRDPSAITSKKVSTVREAVKRGLYKYIPDTSEEELEVLLKLENDHEEAFRFMKNHGIRDENILKKLIVLKKSGLDRKEVEELAKRLATDHSFYRSFEEYEINPNIAVDIIRRFGIDHLRNAVVYGLEVKKREEKRTKKEPEKLKYNNKKILKDPEHIISFLENKITPQKKNVILRKEVMSFLGVKDNVMEKREFLGKLTKRLKKMGIGTEQIKKVKGKLRRRLGI